MAWDKVVQQLTEIYAQLPEFAQHRRIVFWYDGQAEFNDYIPQLSLPGVEVAVLQPGKGAFALKCRIEQEQDKNFLIYAPFDKPSPERYWLQDVYEYSTEFSADLSALVLRDLGIYSGDLVPVARKYTKFLGNQDRIDKLRKYELKAPREQDFIYAIHALLCGCDTPSLEQVTFSLLSDWATGETRCQQQIEKLGDWKAIWEMIYSKFALRLDASYGGEPREFALRAFASALELQIEGKIPGLKNYVCGDKVSLAALLDTMRAMKTEGFKALSDKVADLFNLRSLIQKDDVACYAGCGLFKLFDENAVAMMASRLAQKNGGTSADKDILNARRDCRSPWAAEFHSEYGALHAAYGFVSKYNTLPDGRLPHIMDVESLQKLYTEDWYLFDQCYRRFVKFSQSTDNELIHKLAERIEYLYVDQYLNEVSAVWDGAVSGRVSMGLLWSGHNPQWHFFDSAVKRNVDAGNRLVVIISDALRFEVAKELAEVLGQEHREAKLELDYMTSAIPSVTHFGLAALLPGSQRALKEAKSVTVDGMPSGSTENRDAILKKNSNDNIAVTWAQLRNAGRDGYRALLQEKKVVYIYHNTIDAVGEKPENAGTVPAECSRAIDDLVRLVRSLFNFVSAGNIVITADHGFIYQNKALAEYDKIPASQENAVEGSYRYIISRARAEAPGWHALDMEYLLHGSGLYANIPYGLQRIAKQGSPRQYTHGGLTLQETVVPLLRFSKSKSSVNQQREVVDVDLSGIRSAIHNRFFKITFLQKEAVGVNKIPRNLRMAFEDSAGRQISNVAQYVADSRDDNVDRRRFSLQFTLKDAAYSAGETYYLVMNDVVERDGDEIVTEYQRVPFTINLLISDQF